MKIAPVIALLALATAGAPAQAAPVTYTGTVRYGVASPSVARTLYQQSSSTNGTAGVVIALPSGADGKTYTLTRTSGALGVEDLDAYFYTSIQSEGGSCDVARDVNETGNGESGTICPNPAQNATHVIIVAKAGYSVGFSFTVNL